ncbi:MAG TPA: TetR/AcrR family transcriptional regulator [Kofleriaceae bacterium]|nr:TetR/AcrR family transcriptional regulator [Kofleriaceae bacterium]
MAVRRVSKPSSDRILEAAEDVFAEHGYGEVSLRQLMAAAGVSTTAFYARFDSKEAVMAALTTRLFSELHDEAPSVLDQAKSFEAGIERGVELLCAKFGPRKPLVRAILAEAGSSPAVVEARKRAYGLLAAFLAARFWVLVERKKLAIEDPTALAWALVGALEIQIVRWAVWDDIDLETLRTSLRAVAHAVLPRRARGDRT